MDLNIIILAGGKGERLWPLARPEMPKPFLKLLSEKTLLEETIDRFAPLGPVFVLMPKRMIDMAKEIIPEGLVEYIEEPYPSGTAVAMRYAADQFTGKEKLLFTPADQMVEDVSKLHEAIAGALPFVEKGKIVLCGATPEYPCEHYGYLTLGENGKLEKFIEKPGKAVAKKICGSKKALWHMGIDLMRVDALIEAWDQYYSPETRSFEHAVLSKAHDLYAAKVESKFKDLGTFEAIVDYLDQKKVTRSNENNNFFIYSHNLPVKIENIDNLIVVATENGILIRKK